MKSWSASTTSLSSSLFNFNLGSVNLSHPPLKGKKILAVDFYKLLKENYCVSPLQEVERQPPLAVVNGQPVALTAWIFDTSEEEQEDPVSLASTPACLSSVVLLLG